MIDRTTVPPSCDVPEALSDFLAARDPLSDLDAALLFAESYLRGDPEDASAVREALRKVCGSSSRWAAGRLLAERAAYGAATGVEFRWLDESEAREALRAAEQRSMEPWPDARHLVSTLRQVPGVGTAAFDASTVRNRRKRHVWEAEALIERASHILGVAPNASDEEIRLRVADLVERLSAPGPLATAGELVEFAASTERERAQLAAAVLLANLHTKNS